VTTLQVIAAVKAPVIDYKGISPLFAVAGGAVIVLLAALFRGRFVQRVLVPFLTVGALGAAIGLTIWNWHTGDSRPIIEGALSIDPLALGLSLLFYISGLATVAYAWRSVALRESGTGEFFALILGSIAGMNILASSENLVTLFVGIELLSIPLYVLCASDVRRATSLESGLKYLVIGSVGSATLLYGLAFLYGATGHTGFGQINDAIGTGIKINDPLLLTGARRLRGRPHAGHRVHGGCHQDGSIRDHPPPLPRGAHHRSDPVGAGAGRARGDHDHRG
jgi:NADH-quinone oxidoreductase subunit N